ncbi:MAG: hypothetical protein E7080_06560 [Bacteroidales bacterium]|nr:hypothetical protein [Bacteroidales bacterium]
MNSVQSSSLYSHSSHSLRNEPFTTSCAIIIASTATIIAKAIYSYYNSLISKLKESIQTPHNVTIDYYLENLKNS